MPTREPERQLAEFIAKFTPEMGKLQSCRIPTSYCEAAAMSCAAFDSSPPLRSTTPKFAS